MKLENYFVDRTKIEADANRHKVVWAKSRTKYAGRLREKVKELLKEIEAENEAENGYRIEVKHYEATACHACPLKPECTHAKGNRHLRVSFRLRQFRQQASASSALRAVGSGNL